MPYVDVKHSVWIRYEVTNEDLKKFKNRSSRNAWRDLIDSHYTSEWLYDTSEYMSPEANGNIPTVEVYDDANKIYWNNTPKAVNRQRKLDELMKDTNTSQDYIWIL